MECMFIRVIQPVKKVRALTASSFLFPVSMLADTGFNKCICLTRLLHRGAEECCVLEEFGLRLQREVVNLSSSCRCVHRSAV